jgi:hypothetical protein
MIDGACDPRFAAVRDAFAAAFDAGREIGASFAATVDGRMVVDLWGGHADAARTRAWERDTVVNVFSTTKAMTALGAVVGAGQRERIPRGDRPRCARELGLRDEQDGSGHGGRHARLRFDGGVVRRALTASRRTGITGPRHGPTQKTGAGVFGCATNLSTRSLLAVDGGFPLALAGASEQ